MKRFMVLAISLALFLSGCGGSSTQTGENEQSEMESEPRDGETEKNEDSDRPEENRITMVMKSAETTIPERVLTNSSNITAANTEETTFNETDPQGTVSSGKDYTVMIYMIGSTLEYDDTYGLCGAASADIQEMLYAGVDYSKVNIVLYTGGAHAWAVDIPSDENCIIDLGKYDGSGTLRSSIVAVQKPAPNMGDPGTLSAFVNFCTDHYPAEHYGLICWDHGGGSVNGYGYDVNYAGDGLLLSEMKTAMDDTSFADTRKLDFVGFDACLMASLENANIWKDYADYMIASEELEAGIGWDYRSLQVLNDSQNPIDVAGEIIAGSAGMLKDVGVDYTLSCADLSKTGSVVSSLDQFFDGMNHGIESGEATSISRKRIETKEFGKAESMESVDSELVDIVDLSKKMETLYPEQSKSLSQAVEGMVVLQDTNVYGSHGLSLYYPENEIALFLEAYQDYYAQINPSIMYERFLESFAKMWGTETNGTSEMNEEIKPATGEGIPFALTDQQLSDFVSASYTIYGTYGIDQQDYAPVLMDVPVYPDEDGVIWIPEDPNILCLKTDSSDDMVPWRVRLIEQNESRSIFETMTTLLSSGPDFTDIYDPTAAPVNISIIENESGIEVQDIRPLTEDINGSGRASVDLSRYEGLMFVEETYHAERNQDGFLLPFTEWTKGSWKGSNNMPLDSDYQFVWGHASEFQQPFVVQITIRDVYGNIGTSELVPLEKKDEIFCGVETEHGMYRFKMHDDHVELVGYDGEDKNLIIPDDVNELPVTCIANNAFANADKLETVSCPKEMRSIGQMAFARCEALKSVILPDALKKIGYRAFAECKAMDQLVLPESLEEIEKSAFYGCESLKQIMIPGNVSVIGDGAFAKCSGLESITVSPNCRAYKLEDNLLLTGDGKKVLAAPQGAGTFIRIPEGAEEIGYAAFAGYDELRMVEFPSTLKTIENYAFYHCGSLLNLKLPEQIERIGVQAFGKYDYVNLGDTNESTADIYMDYLEIGESADYIGEDAFSEVKVQSFLVDPGNQVYSTNNGFLTNRGGDFVLEAPAGIVGEVVIPEGIAGIRDMIFYYYDSASDFYLPDSLIRIPENAFSKKNDELTIHAHKRTAAEAYANERGIRFVPIE